MGLLKSYGSLCPAHSILQDINNSECNMYQHIGLSKLAQIYWTRELARRLSEEGSSIIVLALHQGVIYTGS